MRLLFARRTAYAIAAGLGVTAAVQAQTQPAGVFVEIPYDQRTPSPYPMPGADRFRTQRTIERVEAQRPSLQWVFTLPQRRLHTPIVSASGTLFVGGDEGLCAVDARGQLRWFRKLGALRFSPTLLPSGDLLVTLERGGLVMVGQQGEARGRLWDYLAAVPPLVLPNGQLAILDPEGVLHLVSIDGERSARVTLGPPAHFGSLAFAPDGTILVAIGARLARITQMGEVLSDTTLDAPVVAGPVVGVERWYSLLGNGRLWVSPVGAGASSSIALAAGGGLSSIALAHDDSLRVTADSRQLIGLHTPGKERFRRAFDGELGRPLLTSDGLTLLITDRGFLYGVEGDGRLRFRLPTRAQGSPTPVVGIDGAIYVASHDGRLSAWR